MRMDELVRAAHTWPSNAELIAEVAKLYIPQGAKVLDPTYGRGTWWKKFRPDDLTMHDLHKLDGVDFRSLPEPDGTFDVVVFDPPYIAPGGRRTSTIDDFNDRFGLTDAPATPMGQRHYNAAGLKECMRVTRAKGRILVKAMDYVSGGAFFPGTHYVVADALELGLRYVDRFEHVRPRLGVQPDHARQLHARRNLSTLLVFEVPRQRRVAVYAIDCDLDGDCSCGVARG